MRKLTAIILILFQAAFLPCRMEAQEAPVRLDNGPRSASESHKVLLYPYPAADSLRSDVAVIICPGGSYFWLDMKNEGFAVASWLQSQGINAFVLKYRTAGIFDFLHGVRVAFRGRRHPDMITDAQRAIRWVRGNAGRYGIDSAKVGVMGFSAGGHLAMSAACFHDTDFASGSPAADGSLRPSFVVPVYPVVTMSGDCVHKRSRRGLLGEDHTSDCIMRDSLSLEKHIPADCPPVFIVNCADDPVVDSRNSVLLDSALVAAGVQHTYVRYERGGHGFGVSDAAGSPESRQWKHEFIKWLKKIGIL